MVSEWAVMSQALCVHLVSGPGEWLGILGSRPGETGELGECRACRRAGRWAPGSMGPTDSMRSTGPMVPGSQCPWDCMVPMVSRAPMVPESPWPQVSMGRSAPGSLAHAAHGVHHIGRHHHRRHRQQHHHRRHRCSSRANSLVLSPSATPW